MTDQKPQTKKRILFVLFRRLLLLLTTTAAMIAAALYLLLRLVFLGPYPTARNALTIQLSEMSCTEWIPAFFLGDGATAKIKAGEVSRLALDAPEEPIEITLLRDCVTADGDEWDAYPDGIRIETVYGDTYRGYLMIIRDPSRVYLSASSNNFSMEIPGARINAQMEYEKAAAAINGGAFFDDGSARPEIGSVPCGLVYSRGACLWDDQTSYYGFIGLTRDNVCVTADKMTKQEAEELGIRDGCCFGPVLIHNGDANEKTYNFASGYNPRTCIGQRADGAIVFLCFDGRYAGSLGASYADMIDVLLENDVINACNLDGGASTAMLYRDTHGIYGEPGRVQMVNQYSLLQQIPRKMPTFFMVTPLEQEVGE